MVELALTDAGPEAVVAEYGAGTGSFTREILERLAPGQRFFAIEVNERLAETLRERFPTLHLHVGCASRVAEYCAAEDVDGIDAVVSGLPWAVFPDELQESILGGTMAVLKPGGRFVTFAYLHALGMPSARAFRKRLEGHFSEVRVSKPVWLNVPPAVCYDCVR